MPAHHVRRCKRNIVGRNLRAAYRCIEHASNDVVGLFDCAGLTVHDEAVTIDAQRNRKSILER